MHKSSNLVGYVEVLARRDDADLEFAKEEFIEHFVDIYGYGERSDFSKSKEISDNRLVFELYGDQVVWTEMEEEIHKVGNECGVLLRVMVYGHDFPLDAQNRYFFGQGADLARADHLRDSAIKAIDNIRETDIASEEIRTRLTAIQTHMTEVLDDIS